MGSEEETEEAPDNHTYSSERGRGILTPSDREFLSGQKTDYAKHSKKQKRNRIRRRLRNAVLDFTILFDHLEDHDREMVFASNDENREAFSRGITDGLAFIYLGTTGYPVSFDDFLAMGVNRSEQKLAGSDFRMVDVEFEVDRVGQIDVDEFLDKFEEKRFDELSGEELRAFVWFLGESDEFSPDSVRSAMEDRMAELLANVQQSKPSEEGG